ncbi:MAG: alanine--tRNA ligase [Candidatus Villigracilaceae bacterium]
MIAKKFTGNEIRQTFIDFFVQRGHTFVPSMSLVPGGDATLLFTNSGMVQFKDVFLGTDIRPYKRAANSQKCMRVAGKHNDLDDVGRDDTHHTFFEMLGNWSFGDYYKEEAIAWSWELLTEVWGLPKERLYATCFKDDKGNIPTDDEAAEIWRRQPGFDPSHVLFFGRKENFWQMADTGPSGPCSEIHIDLGEERDNLRGQPHRCGVNGECTRFLELWNNVFIQYNQYEDGRLETLPAKHVDTGMGFERIVAVLQGVDSNYKTDLFAGALDVLSTLTGKSREQMYADFTPYRVICDHARAAAFLIADGVVPGNAGRNYVTRMIIRRAARFGTKIGLTEPFLARVAEAFIEQYGSFYSELVQHRDEILSNLTREEVRFARTIESGTARLQGMLDELKASGAKILDGRLAFDLYATNGIPFEISRDIAREQGLEIDEDGFRVAKEEHSLASGGGKAMGELGGEDAAFFAAILKDLQAKGKLSEKGVEHDPYTRIRVEGEVLALVMNGQQVNEAQFGDRVEVILPKTAFYIESGGQVSDTGTITSVKTADSEGWEIEISDVRRPSAGVIVHVGEVVSGKPRVGDLAVVAVDADRRHDIMRNHTATHLLHRALRNVLGEQARQAGSLVAPDRLRFDFNYPEALTPEQIELVEQQVNAAIAADYCVVPTVKPREQAIAEGAMAIFSEKYGQEVRTIAIEGANCSLPESDGGEPGGRYSYELCGGTHLQRTSDVGVFVITAEGSAAAGVRRIEAVTGRGAYALIARRLKSLTRAAALLSVTVDEVPERLENLQGELSTARKEIAALRAERALSAFDLQLEKVQMVSGVAVLAAEIPHADADTLRMLSDRFRAQYTSGVCLLASVGNGKALLIAALSDDLVKRGWKAGDIIAAVGGRGGGKPALAQGSLADASLLDSALAETTRVIAAKLA